MLRKAKFSKWAKTIRPPGVIGKNPTPRLSDKRLEEARQAMLTNSKAWAPVPIPTPPNTTEATIVEMAKKMGINEAQLERYLKQPRNPVQPDMQRVAALEQERLAKLAKEHSYEAYRDQQMSQIRPPKKLEDTIDEEVKKLQKMF